MHTHTYTLRHTLTQTHIYLQQNICHIECQEVCVSILLLLIKIKDSLRWYIIWSFSGTVKRTYISLFLVSADVFACRAWFVLSMSWWYEWSLSSLFDRKRTRGLERRAVFHCLVASEEKSEFKSSWVWLQSHELQLSLQLILSHLTNCFYSVSALGANGVLCGDWC